MLNEKLKRLKFAWSYMQKNILHLNLQILYQCNFKCRICDFWKDDSKKQLRLSVNDARIISQKLKKIGPMICTMGGGEPLLHKDLLEIVKILSKNNFMVMISNGWYINDSKAKEIWEAGFLEVSVSIDYIDPSKHDVNRGKKGAYERAVSALESLARNRTNPYQRINMISVVMDDNLDDIEELIKLSREIGITYMVTSYSRNRGDKENAGYKKDVSQHLLDLKKRYNNFVSIRGYLERFNETIYNVNGITPCYAGRHFMNIDCKGNVSGCIDNIGKPIGNILSEDIKELQKKMLLEQKKNSCGNCWTSCRGPVETLLYGKGRMRNLLDNYQITKKVPLNGPF